MPRVLPFSMCQTARLRLRFGAASQRSARRACPVRARRDPSPVFFVEAPGTPLFRLPLKKEGTERREARPVSVRSALPFPKARAPLGAPWRFRVSGFRRKTQAPGPRFSGTRLVCRSQSASSSRRGRSAPRAGSRASRVGVTNPGRGAHPTPLTRRLMRTPSSGWDTTRKTYLGNIVNRYLSYQPANYRASGPASRLLSRSMASARPATSRRAARPRTAAWRSAG